MNIKPNAEGIFYPKASKALLNLFSGYHNKIKSENSKLIIVPHAGYEFSGGLAFKTYQYLKKDLKKILIFAPSIYNKLYGIVTTDAETISTPLGKIKIKPYNCNINNKICETEPALGVQIPLIKHFYPNIFVTPIIYGCADFHSITKIIKEEYEQNVGIVIVTNLSRFVPARQALKLDNHLSRIINKLQIQDLDNELADGAIGICAAIEFAKNQNLKLISAGHNLSSDINGDTSSVVGYGSWYLSTQ